MNAALHDGLRGVRARRGRALLAGLGIAMAAAMLAAAATVSYGLATGFSRSARAAGLADVIARFAPQPATTLARRIAALPDVAAFTLGRELTGVALSVRGHEAGNGVLEVLGPGRRGYAIVAGHDVSSAHGGVVLAQGLASSWGLRVGDAIEVAGFGRQRIVGLAEEPDDVSYPLAAPRLYASPAILEQRSAHVVAPPGLELFAPQPSLPAAAGKSAGPGGPPQPARAAAQSATSLALPGASAAGGSAVLGESGLGSVTVAKIWLRDPAQLDTVLAQARASSYGLRDLRLVTRSGVRVLLDEAAGIVIALLGALSAIALLTAGVMLAASARTEVQRRLHAFGVRRALGASRVYVAGSSALETLIVAAPAAAVGVAAGALVANGPDDRLLALLNERGPGGALALPLIGCLAVAVALPVLSSAWPAWSACGRPPVELLRGAELRKGGRAAPRSRAGGLAGLGVRLVAARRARLLATLALVGVSAAFVLLMLALASELVTLENDPKALGRRYQLTAELPAAAARRVADLRGVAAVAPRYELTALDSFSLGETIDVIAYPGAHSEFEAPPLVAGRRLRGTDETEVGNGLAQVLGLSVGSTLALALPGGDELRLRVAGIVDSLDHDGRMAYVPAAALLAREPAASEQLAIRLRAGASAGSVAAALGGGGAGVSRTATVTGQGSALVAALSAVLRAVAVIDGLVCLYALVQGLALTAYERRTTISVLRACGAGAPAVRALLAGAALAVIVPAALVAVLLERLVLGPELAHLAASYVSLALAAGPSEIAALAAGLAALAAGSIWWVARLACREPIPAGLA